MSNTPIPPAEPVHRLLFQALIQMRAEGAESGNKVVYHLANLFHQVVLRMERAAAGDESYNAVLGFAQEHARELGLSGWLDSTLRTIEETRTPVA